MQFQSFFFLLFFFFVCVGFYLVPGKVRKVWLLMASWLFYLSLSPEYMGYLLGIIFVSYLLGILVEKTQRKSIHLRHCVLGGAIVTVLATLLVVKYGTFIVDNINRLLAVFSVRSSFSIPKIIQPVGISFFTFAAVGYLIDIYREKRCAEKNILSFALFLSFFPTIMSGPIERSTNFLKQIDECSQYTLNPFRIRHGLLTMLYGYFLKTMLADRLSVLVASIFDGYEAYGSLVISLGVVAFGIQLYCDFAGISCIAIGASEVMGFSLIQNFETPYFSTSVSEFWRRWHISLSSWFRDYLYIPLGGNRKGKARKYLNIMIVFLVSGIWHGAGWSFIIWGGLNGAYQVVGDLLKPIRQKVVKVFHVDTNNAGNRFLRITFVFLLVNFAWLFFRAPDLATALLMLKQAFSGAMLWQLFDGTLLKLGLDYQDWLLLLVSLLVMILISVSQYRHQDWRVGLMRQGLAFRIFVYVICIVAVLIFGIYGSAYSASSFIYVDF